MPRRGLYPRTAPRRTQSHAEGRLYAALARGLPEGWVAWHSLRVRTDEGQEAEADFVVAVPDRGAIVIEVKGGRVEVRDGTWLQNGRVMDPLPRDQGHRIRRALVAKLEKTHGGFLPVVVVATAFPDTGFDREPDQGDVRGAVLGQHDLPYLAQALPALAERLFVPPRPPRDGAWIEALHRLWGETWTPRLSLGCRIRLREDELVQLDREQVAVLDMIDRNPRLHVLGGPGTGKTLLAREICRRLTERGRRPVLLCWTRALAQELRATGLADAWTVRELAANLLERAGIALQGGAPRSEWSPATWDEAPLHAAVDALAALGSQHDAVVLDEAQDLTSNDWELVRALAGQGPLWAFGDDGQGFWDDRAVPAGLFPFRLALTERYRCPEPLARFADRYRPGAPTPAACPRPDELRVVRAPSESALADKVALEIDKAVSEGAAPGDVAVLSLAGQTRTRLCGGERIGRHRVVRADATDAPAHVVADTFLRFKGLERPWIILTELSLGERRRDVRMHVALTRATVGCVIVATGDELARDARLA